jgi:hypothetical protein
MSEGAAQPLGRGALEISKSMKYVTDVEPGISSHDVMGTPPQRFHLSDEIALLFGQLLELHFRHSPTRRAPVNVLAAGLEPNARISGSIWFPSRMSDEEKRERQHHADVADERSGD